MWVVDISGSMAAKDGGETSRLDRVKDFVRSQIANMPVRESVGIVAFAREVHVVSPVTNRRDLAIELLDGLRVDSRDNRTNIGEAILVAIDRLRLGEGDPAGRLVLVTDGAQTVAGAPSVEEGFRVAQALSIPVDVHCLANPEDPQFAEDRDRLRRAVEWTGGQWIEPDQPSPAKSSFSEPSSAEGRGIALDSWSTWLLLAASLIALVEFLARTTILRVQPPPVG